MTDNQMVIKGEICRLALASGLVIRHRANDLIVYSDTNRLKAVFVVHDTLVRMTPANSGRRLLRQRVFEVTDPGMFDAIESAIELMARQTTERPEAP